MIIHDHKVGPVLLEEILDSLQSSLRVVMVVADQGAGKDGLVPFVQQVHFGGGDVELAVQARQDGFDAAALVF